MEKIIFFWDIFFKMYSDCRVYFLDKYLNLFVKVGLFVVQYFYYICDFQFFEAVE